MRVAGQCYATQAEACAAADCPAERCLLLDSYPAQVQCEPPQVGAADVTTPEPSLVGAWVGDSSCVADMQGMEGADEATIESVAAQVAMNTFVFTDATLEHSIGQTAGSAEPYTVISHDGATWTIEMAGSTGAPQRTDIVIDSDQMRMSRDQALVICLRREP